MAMGGLCCDNDKGVTSYLQLYTLCKLPEGIGHCYPIGKDRMDVCEVLPIDTIKIRRSILNTGADPGLEEGGSTMKT